MACSSTPPLSTNWSKRTANHFSLRVKGIMVSVVSQMLCQDLNISDPHHPAATFYLRGHLNTSILCSTPNNTSTPEPWRTFKSPPSFILPSTIFHTQRAPCNCEHHQSQQLFMCCIERNPHGGITAYVAPGPVIPT